MRCDPENDAYVAGSMFQKFATDGADFKSTTLNERWEKIAYLDSSSYDTPSLSPPTPPTAATCIFNQRLAKIQHATRPDLVVATSCNPFALLSCRLEYDNAQLLQEHCDCNYHYSVKEKNSSGNTVCRGKAGVPCKFGSESIVDPFLKPTSIECQDSLVCIEEPDAEKRNDIFSKSFHGFGLSTTAREFMVANALGYCACNDNNFRVNVMNECTMAATSVIDSNMCLIIIAMVIEFIFQN
ncbi:unnamed protein product [Orchesella dallaii]|uniref:Uncharacterized protein n=1 Tax=Orchesella dallaii TaxID=48710 RepID=A0ABP1S490_9HEXA